MPPSPIAHDPLAAAWSALAAADAKAIDAALAAVPEAVADTAEGLRLAARSAQRKGLAEAAMTLLARALERDAANPLVLVDLALLYLQAGQAEAARPLLAEALRLDDGQPEAHAALATLAEEAGDLDGAARHLRAACAGALARRAGLSVRGKPSGRHR